jgi:hypothetical protein
LLLLPEHFFRLIIALPFSSRLTDFKGASILRFCMAGRERERKGKKKVEARFNDPKRPKPSKVELKARSGKREGFKIVSESCATFFFCPFDGEKLSGRLSKCPKCAEKWEGAFSVRAGRSVWAALVDVREFLGFWRRLSLTALSTVTYNLWL